MNNQLNIEEQKTQIKKILLDNDVKSSLKTKKQIIFDIIPELKDEDGFDQKSPWHIYDVWDHTVAAIENSNPDLEIRLSLLLHDIGKPHSYQNDGVIRHFKGHAEKSAEIAEAILTRLGYSQQHVADMCYLIRNHSTIINVDDINEQNLEITKKLLQIQYCDTSAYNPKYTESVFKRLDRIGKGLKEKEKLIISKRKKDKER